MPDRDQSGFSPLPDDVKRTPKPRPRSMPHAPERRSTAGYNLFTLLFLVGACGLIYLYATIWSDPYSAVNPFPPDTPFPVVVSETPQATLTLTPTITRTPNPTASITASPAATTPAATLTFTPLPADQVQLLLGTPQGSSDPDQPPAPTEPGLPFVLQGGRVVYITNPEGRGGCAWSSITGTVIDSTGAGVVGYGVRIAGEGFDQTVATGSDRASGAGGFEVQLGTEAAAGTYTVQLLDPSGAPASDEYTITTRADCAYNIAAVRFVQGG